MSKLYHPNALTWSDIALRSPTAPTRAVSTNARQFYTGQTSDFSDLTTTNPFARRQSSVGITRHSEPAPLANLNINTLHAALSSHTNGSSKTGGGSSIRPSSGSQLRTTAPLWSAANNQLNDTVTQPLATTRRQHSTPASLHAGNGGGGGGSGADTWAGKLQFNRVTTLGHTQLNATTVSNKSSGILSVPLTHRSQSHSTTSAPPPPHQQHSHHHQHHNTPGKQKLMQTLDTTHARRHRHLPSIDADTLSAPISLNHTTTRSVSTNDAGPTTGRRASAAIKRQQSGNSTSHILNTSLLPSNSNINHHTTTTSNDKQWPFDAAITIQPSPQSAQIDIQSPTKRSLVQSGAQSVLHQASAANVPLLTLPTQPNGTTAQQAATDLLSQPTHRQPSAPPARPPAGQVSNRLSARVQQRRVGRAVAQSATPKNSVHSAALHQRTGSTVITPPQSSTYAFDCGVSEDANQRFRATMEDAHIHLSGYGLDHITDDCQRDWQNCVGYAGIYDGHGGRECVDFVVHHLHAQLAKELRAQMHSNDIPLALKDAYLKTDDAMRNDINMQECGSTAVSVLIRPSHTRPGQRDLFVANVGDARAVMAVADGSSSSDVSAIRLSKDHTPRTPTEINRVIRAGGCVFNNRVAGQLAVSRALGDIALKRAGVSAVPYVNKVELNEQHRFMVVACDGLWDVVSDLEAVQLVSGLRDADEMARRLVAVALDRGTTDNVSVMCIRLHKS